MPPSLTYAPDLVSAALAGYTQGLPQRVIAEVLRVPRRTLRYWFEAYDEGLLALSVPEHDHHWIIESPEGGMSPGVCRICFSQRDFKNTLEVNNRWKGSSES